MGTRRAWANEHLPIRPPRFLAGPRHRIDLLRAFAHWSVFVSKFRKWINTDDGAEWAAIVIGFVGWAVIL